VYRRSIDGWLMYFSARRRRAAAIYRYEGIFVDNKPATSTTMVSMGFRGVIGTGGLYTVDTIALWSVTPTPPTANDLLRGPFDPILSAVNASIAYPRILLDSVVFPNDGGEAIAKDIRDDTARAVSDGSFNPVTPIGSSCTSALNISASYDNVDGLGAVNWVPGTIIDQSACRSELTVVCGTLACLSTIVQRFDTEAGGITIALDGEAVLNQSKGNWPLIISQPCFDMLQDIRTRTDLLPIKITWKWVEGHQDDNRYVALDWWASMNIKMDTLAKEFLEDCTAMHPSREHKPQQLLYEKWALEIRGVKQSSIT